METEAGTMKVSKIAPRLIISKVHNKPPKLVEDGEVFRVAGIVKRIESIDTGHGSVERLRGKFFAVSGDVVFESSVLYLPQNGMDVIKATGVPVPFEVGFAVSKTSEEGAGYAYTAEPLVMPMPCSFESRMISMLTDSVYQPMV